MTKLFIIVFDDFLDIVLFEEILDFLVLLFDHFSQCGTHWQLIYEWCIFKRCVLSVFDAYLIRVVSNVAVAPRYKSGDAVVYAVSITTAGF